MTCPTALEHYRQGFDDYAAIQQEASPASGQRGDPGDLGHGQGIGHAGRRRALGGGRPPDERPRWRPRTSCPSTSTTATGSWSRSATRDCTSSGWTPTEQHRVTFSIRGPWLKPGRYTVDVFVCQAGVLDAWDGAESFEVLPIVPYPQSDGGESIAVGVVLADFDVKAEQL